MPQPSAYFQKQIMPLSDAKISIMTHAFLYGTGVFEGIRGNWNSDAGTLYLFRMEDHYKRLQASGKILRIGLGHSVNELCDITERLVGVSGYKEDVYIRP